MPIYVLQIIYIYIYIYIYTDRIPMVDDASCQRIIYIVQKKVLNPLSMGSSANISQVRRNISSHLKHSFSF